MEVELSSNINATDVRKKIFLEKTDLSCLDELHENTKNILMDYLQTISLWYNKFLIKLNYNLTEDTVMNK